MDLKCIAFISFKSNGKSILICILCIILMFRDRLIIEQKMLQIYVSTLVPTQQSIQFDIK